MLSYMHCSRENAYFAITKRLTVRSKSRIFPRAKTLEIQVWHEHAAGGNGALFKFDTPAGKDH